MIATLAFTAAPVALGRRAVRPAAFVPRSNLPLSAACLVANGVREALARLLATEIDVELFEPAVPGDDERRVLLAGATIRRVRGRIGDAFVIVRPADARALVARAFDERERPRDAPLSEIESATFERMLQGIVPLCNALCGNLGAVARESPDRAAADLATYFEVRTLGAERIAIGFGVTTDPPATVEERITLDDLADVELSGAVEVGTGPLALAHFADLAVGSTIALATRLGATGVLRFGRIPFAPVVCGARDGRRALRIDAGRGA